MAVYMVRAGEFGPVKIGVAEDISRRLAHMQADNHERLTVIRAFEGSYELEEMLHARFEGSHLRGEWFAYHEDMVREDFGVAELKVCGRGKPHIAPALESVIAARVCGSSDASAEVEPFAQRIKRLRLEKKINQVSAAKALEIAQGHLSSIESGAHGASVELIRRMASLYETTIDYVVGGDAPTQAAP